MGPQGAQRVILVPMLEPCWLILVPFFDEIWIPNGAMWMLHRFKKFAARFPFTCQDRFPLLVSQCVSGRLKKVSQKWYQKRYPKWTPNGPQNGPKGYQKALKSGVQKRVSKRVPLREGK